MGYFCFCLLNSANYIIYLRNPNFLIAFSHNFIYNMYIALENYTVYEDRLKIKISVIASKLFSDPICSRSTPVFSVNLRKCIERYGHNFENRC